MPSLFRFIFIVTTLGAVVFGALYVTATKYEPEQREETKSLPSLKIRKE
jgi:hypothetical protein